MQRIEYFCSTYSNVPKIMKDASKKCMDNSNKTGQSPEFCQFYHDLDEILGIRDVVNFSFAR